LAKEYWPAGHGKIFIRAPLVRTLAFVGQPQDIGSVCRDSGRLERPMWGREAPRYALLSARGFRIPNDVIDALGDVIAARAVL